MPAGAGPESLPHHPEGRALGRLCVASESGRYLGVLIFKAHTEGEGRRRTLRTCTLRLGLWNTLTAYNQEKQVL